MSSEATPCPGISGNVFSGQCPSRQILDLIADKWTLLIVHLLVAGPRRNSELLRAIDGISQKMLTQTLRELERNGLVKRTDYGEIPPRVDYSLTALGLSLAEPVKALDRWVEQHFYLVEAARQAFGEGDA